MSNLSGLVLHNLFNFFSHSRVVYISSMKKGQLLQWVFRATLQHTQRPKQWDMVVVIPLSSRQFSNICQVSTRLEPHLGGQSPTALTNRVTREVKDLRFSVGFINGFACFKKPFPFWKKWKKRQMNRSYCTTWEMEAEMQN